MTSCETTLTKQPSERIYFTMDFSARMATSDTIVSATVSSEKIDGTSSDLTIDSPATIDGQTVKFWISGGTNNQRYRIEVQITTSTTAILEGDGTLFVTDRY